MVMVSARGHTGFSYADKAQYAPAVYSVLYVFNKKAL